ncbi:MAG TPA: 50S ribosomal protein L11 methyltransferase [Candidatus Eisenbacteria bacterium]|nr:50S ribosomal protein L11 methyltransferase [Candidatus Eisenbacteria bacterium]
MAGLIVTIITVIQGLLLVAAALMVSWLAFLIAAPGYADGPPFVATKREQAEIMAGFAALRPGETVVDLGSGDGRLLIAAARSGCAAVGYEINPFLVLWTRFKARRNGVSRLVRVHCANFWKADLSAADVVMVFGFAGIMERLGRKFADELKPGARIVAHRYPLPGWRTAAEADRVYLYRKEA